MQARQQKEVVLQSKKKDVLGLSKPEWDASCATVEPLCQRRSRQISKVALRWGSVVVLWGI